MKPQNNRKSMVVLSCAIALLAVSQVAMYFVLTFDIQAAEKRRAEESFQLRLEVERLKQETTSS